MVALTPLLDERAVGALLDLRARGFDLAIVEISPVPFTVPGEDELERLAHRLWRLRREALRAQLRAGRRPGGRLGRRRLARRRAGGGERIPAARASHRRLLTAGWSLIVLGALIAYASLRTDRLGVVVAGVGGFAVILLVVALATRLPGVVAWAIACAGGAYAVSLLLTGGTIDGFAPLYAVGLLLISELAYWSLELQMPAEPGIVNRRAGRLALLLLVSGGVSALVLAVSELATEGGLALEALGVAALGGALALVAVLLWSTRSHTP